MYIYIYLRSSRYKSGFFLICAHFDYTTMSSVHLHVLVFTLMASSTSTIYGESRDLVPLESPANLTLLAIRGHQALVEWEPVQPDSVRGSFRGYLVRTWSHLGSQVYVFPPDVTRANVDFFPHAKNFITVSVRNDKYVGSPSEAVSFDAPQIEPNPPLSFDLFTLSNRSVLLRWKRPEVSNGVLLGYKVYCSEVDDGVPGGRASQNAHRIDDPEKLQAKMTGLQEGVHYVFGISALNCAGESEINEIHVTVGPHTPAAPYPSKLVYRINYTLLAEKELCSTPTALDESSEEEQEPQGRGKQMLEYDYYDYLGFNDTKKTEVTESRPESEIDYEKRCIVSCMIMWLPDVKNQPGDHFYIKYRIKGEQEFQETEPELGEDFIILQKFDACRNYEIIVTAVDGEFSTDSSPFVTPTKIF